MDYALERGLNFWDATIPVNEKTAGETERCIVNWFAQNGRRDEVILATKVTGWSDRHLGLWGEGNGPYVHKGNSNEIAISVLKH